MPFTGVLIKLHRVESLRPILLKSLVGCEKPDLVPLGESL
jgi:hypothetical protein